MDDHRASIEFEGVVDEHGKIAVPTAVLAGLDRKSRSTLHVRLTSKVISTALSKNNVTEEEIDRIGGMQLETREQVVKFLLSEGTLHRNGAFERRGARR